MIPASHPRHPTSVPRSRVRGFMLIEALVAIVIFSIGVLGVIGLHATMARAQADSKFRADAAFLAQRLVGNMWTDRSGLDKYDTTANCASHARCNQWLAQVQNLLPQGGATVAVTSTGTDSAGLVVSADVAITISWTPAGDDVRRFTTVSTVSANL